jgi:hypothetical protein
MPASELTSLLFSIEQATVAIARKHTQLTDKKVETVYLSYRDYFKAMRSGKDLEPPSSTIRMKGDLFNEIWEVLLMREENGYDKQFCNGSWSPGGTPVTSVEQLYIMAFNEVRKSVRRWSKEDGHKNYLKHIQAHVAEHIPLEMTNHHPAITDGTDGPEHVELTKNEPDFVLAKNEYGLLLTLEDVRGMPPELQMLYEDNFGRREDTDPQSHIRYLTNLIGKYPDQALVANELANAHFRAGETEEGERRVRENLELFSDSIPLATGPVMTAQEPAQVLAGAARLGEDLNITHFPAGKDGYYNFMEFIMHEHAATRVLLARGGWELAHLRFERLLRVGLDEFLWQHIAGEFVGNFLDNLDQFRNERTDGLPTPNAVVGAPLASVAVKSEYSEALARIMGNQEDRK